MGNKIVPYGPAVRDLNPSTLGLVGSLIVVVLCQGLTLSLSLSLSFSQERIVCISDGEGCSREIKQNKLQSLSLCIIKSPAGTLLSRHDTKPDRLRHLLSADNNVSQNTELTRINEAN